MVDISSEYGLCEGNMRSEEEFFLLSCTVFLGNSSFIPGNNREQLDCEPLGLRARGGAMAAGDTYASGLRGSFRYFELFVGV